MFGEFPTPNKRDNEPPWYLFILKSLAEGWLGALGGILAALTTTGVHRAIEWLMANQPYIPH